MDQRIKLLGRRLVQVQELKQCLIPSSVAKRRRRHFGFEMRMRRLPFQPIIAATLHAQLLPLAMLSVKI